MPAAPWPRLIVWRLPGQPNQHWDALVSGAQAGGILQRGQSWSRAEQAQSHGMAWHGRPWQAMAQHGMDWHVMAWHGTAGSTTHPGPRGAYIHHCLTWAVLGGSSAVWLRGRSATVYNCVQLHPAGGRGQRAPRPCAHGLIPINYHPSTSPCPSADPRALAAERCWSIWVDGPAPPVPAPGHTPPSLAGSSIPGSRPHPSGLCATEGLCMTLPKDKPRQGYAPCPLLLCPCPLTLGSPWDPVSTGAFPPRGSQRRQSPVTLTHPSCGGTGG